MTVICKDKTYMKKKGDSGKEAIKTVHKTMLAHRKDEEALMSGSMHVPTFQITGLGIIKHKTDINPFERNNSYMKKSLTHS